MVTRDRIGRGSPTDSYPFVRGMESYGQIPLETLVLQRPDVLIVDDAPNGAPVLAYEVLNHPALKALPDDMHVIVLPSRLWPCAGPSIADAVALLAEPATAIRDLASGQQTLPALALSDIRLPRALLGTLFGFTLGLAGAAMQGLLRTPPAEPGIIGISGIAALGAVIVFYSGMASATWPARF